MTYHSEIRYCLGFMGCHVGETGFVLRMLLKIISNSLGPGISASIFHLVIFADNLKLSI